MKIAPRRPGAPVAARLPGGARCGVIGACRRGGGPAIVDAVAAGWTAAARRLALALAAAVLLGGCTGGRDARTSPAAPEAPGKAAWRRLAPAPSERTEVAATAVGTLVYVVGGFRDDGTGPDLPVAVNHAMAATIGGTAYLVGGYPAGGGVSRRAFRLEEGRWLALPDLPEARAAGTAVALDGRLYVAGGVAPGGLAGAMLVYDPTARRWSTAPGPPTRREHLGGAGYGGRVYTVGGRARGRGDFTAAEAFNPGTGQWVRLPDLPTRRGGLAAAATGNGFVVAVGGEATTTFEEAETFDARVGAWSSLPPLPTPRHGLGVVAVGTVLYALAGGPRPGLHVSGAAEAIDLAPLRP